jgi:hypothetical protein
MNSIERDKVIQVHSSICKELYKIYIEYKKLIDNIEPTKIRLGQLQQKLNQQYIIKQQEAHTKIFANPSGLASAAAALIEPAKKIVPKVLSEADMQKRINDQNTKLTKFFNDIQTHLNELNKLKFTQDNEMHNLINFTIDPEKDLYANFNEFYNRFTPIYNSYKISERTLNPTNKQILNELTLILRIINACPVKPVPPESYKSLLEAIGKSRPLSAKGSLNVQEGGKSRKQKIHRRRSHKKQKTKRRRSHKRTSK